MGPTVNLMTEELAEVETGFQLEDSFRLLKQLLLNMKNLTWSLEQMENLIDWWHDMEPLLKIAVPHSSTNWMIWSKRASSASIRLSSACTPSWLRLIRPRMSRLSATALCACTASSRSLPILWSSQSIEAIVDMYAKLASVYKPEDIDSIGDGFVRMHGMVKKFADPGLSISWTDSRTCRLR